MGGASVIAIGAAIGTGVVSDKGIDLEKIKNLPDPSEVLQSTKSLGLPDIKSLKAPTIPSAGDILPKFEGLPSVSVPKLPDNGMKLPNLNLPKVDLPNTLDVKLPEGIKMPDVASVTVPDGIKNLGSAAGGALENALENTGLKLPESPFAKKKPQITSVGQGPYRVPMPYLDDRISEVEKERKAQEAAERVLAAEREEAARMQKIRQDAEAEVMARLNIGREREMQIRMEAEARIQQAADDRVRNAEQEAARLRAEIEQTRLDALAKEKATAEEAAQLKNEAEAAMLEEQAAKEEFTRKLQEAEFAKLKEARDFNAKLAQAEAAAAKERALQEESIAKQKMAEEAATRQAVATAEVRKASIGAAAARKASYSSPSLSTYQAWQERQRTEFRTRMESVAEVKGDRGVTPSTYLSSSQDNLSTYKRWQQNVAAKQVVSMSAEPVKAAYITGAPAPVANQLVSGTTKLSEAAIALNGDLGYVIAGSAALIAGVTYAYENKKIQDELSRIEETKSLASKIGAPPSTTTPPVQPLPPIVPPSSMGQVKEEDAVSATMAIDSKPFSEVSGSESGSVTKEVLPPPRPPQESHASFSGSPTSTTYAAVSTEVLQQTVTAQDTADVDSRDGSYLESMSRSSDGNVPLKSSYSPFSNPKNTVSNDSLYNPPSIAMPQAEEKLEEVSAFQGASASNSGSSNDATNASPTDYTIDEKKTVVNEGSYLDSMASVNGSGTSGLKASYSPFGTPKATTNDSLYDPPEVASVLEEHDASTLSMTEESHVETSILPSHDDVSSANGVSYLECISTSDEEINLKTTYSPFSNIKVSQSTSDSLYDPPYAQNEEMNSSGNSFTDFPDAVTSAQDSYLSALDDSSGPNLKKSYSPFGTKPKAVQDNGLYSPGNFY